MSEALKGRHALVTGGGRGIGAVIASALAAEGAQLTLVGRDEKKLKQHAKALRDVTEVRAIVADVSDEASVAVAFAAARKRGGRIDILVNNAGAAQSLAFDKMNGALWNATLSVNLTGTFLCCVQAVPAMAEARWGRVVNIASTAGLVGAPYVSAYTAAKHGVIGLTRALAAEYARSGVTFNAVCPGFTESELVDEAIANIVARTRRSAEEARTILAARNPIGRLILPHEVASLVAWLCHPDAAAVTGQAIVVAGGEARG